MIDFTYLILRDPVSLIVGGIGLASGVVGGVSSIQQGKAQGRTAEAVGRYNAQVALTEAAVNEYRQRRESDREIGRIRARLGSQGTTLAGSPLDILADQAAEAEEAALLTRYAGQIRAQGAIYEGVAQGAYARSQGLASGLGKFGTGIGTMLGGLANAGVFSGMGGSSRIVGSVPDLSPGAYGQGMFIT